MTKKQAAAQIFWVAKLIGDDLSGDEDAELWILLLQAVARDLDPMNDRYRYVPERGESLMVKMRRLIEHADTPQAERDAAVAAIGRLRAKATS